MRRLIAIMAVSVAVLLPAVAASADTMGGPGDDVIYGTSGADVLSGGGGEDVIHGRGGDDVLYGGPGRDVIHGGPGFDACFVQSVDLVVGCEVVV